MRWRALTAFGRGVVHPGAGIEDQHAVADPGRLAGNHLVDGKGKGPLGDHAGQAIEDLDVHPLELPGPAADRRAPTPGSAGPPAGPASAPGCRPAGRARCGSEWRPPPRPRCPGARPGPAGAGPRASRTRPTRSSRCSVWLVVGRTWPRTTNRSTRALPAGTKSSRSAKHRSDSTPQPADQALQVGDDRVRPGRCALRRARPAWPSQPSPLRPDPLAEAEQTRQVVNVGVELRDAWPPRRPGPRARVAGPASRRATTAKLLEVLPDLGQHPGQLGLVGVERAGQVVAARPARRRRRTGERRALRPRRRAGSRAGPG